MKIPLLSIAALLTAMGSATANISTQRHPMMEDSGIEVIPNFISTSIIDSMKDGLFSDMYADNVRDKRLHEHPLYTERLRLRGREMFLSEEEVGNIKSILGSLPVSSPNGQFITTTKFFETTHPHTDYYHGSYGNLHPVITSTAFVFLEDNDDAYFTIPGMSIPVVKGSLVRFNGALSHQTIINSGSVELLGPFEASWLSAVGGSNSPTDSPTTSKASKESTYSPTEAPSNNPTQAPSKSPTDAPSLSPTMLSGKATKVGKSSSSKSSNSSSNSKSSNTYSKSGKASNALGGKSEAIRRMLNH